MIMKTLRVHVIEVAKRLGVVAPPTGWHGVDAVWPLLQKMKEDGAVFILKIDGERLGEDDNGPYTALVSGPPLQGEAIRTDALSAEDALAYVICHYASRFWGVPMPI